MKKINSLLASLLLVASASADPTGTYHSGSRSSSSKIAKIAAHREGQAGIRASAQAKGMESAQKQKEIAAKKLASQKVKTTQQIPVNGAADQSSILRRQTNLSQAENIPSKTR